MATRPLGLSPNGVPPRIAKRYRPLGLTARMLDYWRASGWLGIQGNGSGSLYPWDDPEVDAQVRWLAELHRAGHELTDEDAQAGFALRDARAEYAVKICGLWQSATSDEIGYAIANGWSFTLARVPLSSSTAPATSQFLRADGDGSGGRGHAPGGAATSAAPISKEAS